jgi:hypothetical protein
LPVEFRKAKVDKGQNIGDVASLVVVIATRKVIRLFIGFCWSDSFYFNFALDSPRGKQEI